MILLRGIVVGVLIALAVSAPTAAASRPTAISMTFIQNADTYETLGWTSAGAVADGGSWVVTRLVVGSPRTMLFGDVDTVQTSPQGSFRLQWHGGTTPVGGIAATWRLTDGTGRYAQLRGEGRWSQAVANGILTFTCWGRVVEAP